MKPPSPKSPMETVARRDLKCRSGSRTCVLGPSSRVGGGGGQVTHLFEPVSSPAQRGRSAHAVGPRDPPCRPGGDGPQPGDWAQGCGREGEWPATCPLPARPASLRREACEVTTTLSPNCSHSPNWPHRSKATASQRLQGWVSRAEGPSSGSGCRLWSQSGELAPHTPLQPGPCSQPVCWSVRYCGS